MTWLIACLCLGVVLAATPAQAQYRNSSFGFDGGYWLIQKPAITDKNGNIIPEAGSRPMRLDNGWRLGGESNFKMSSDHWWFSARVNLGFLSYPNPPDSDQTVTAKFDREANKALGTLLGVEGSIGVRYLIFTDRVRPYVQLGLSYLHLFSFKDASANCSADDIGCTDNGSFEVDYMPHPNVGAFHLQPGVEWVFTRDMAIHFFADLQHWIVYNADDNNAVVLGLGLLFFI